MQQRAARLGGDLVAEPAAGQGFVVSACLPTEDADRRFLPQAAEAARTGQATDQPAPVPVEGGVR